MGARSSMASYLRTVDPCCYRIGKYSFLLNGHGNLGTGKTIYPLFLAGSGTVSSYSTPKDASPCWAWSIFD